MGRKANPLVAWQPSRAATIRVGVALLAIVVGIGPGPANAAGPDPVAAAIALIDTGQFHSADTQIARALQRQNLLGASRSGLEFQRERMRRILLDFKLSEAEVKDRLRKTIPDLREEEFSAWDADGLLEHQVINGRKLYFKSAASNLFHLSQVARARQQPLSPIIDGPLYKLNPYHRQARLEALASGRSSVTPRRVQVTYTLRVDADAVPDGETVRAWLPFPRALPGQQEDIHLSASEPDAPVIAPEAKLQRTVYLERVAHAGRKTEFSITYELTTYGQFHAIDADKVVPAKITPALAEFVTERPPHIVFTPALRTFSREVVGEEKNPYRIAQRLFAAVDRTPWAVAREYSTLSNISDYALHAGHADCGEQTLLLMSLLRLNGIPARWQSGWEISDGSYNDMHDWGGLYLAPYGWLPMDVTHGRLASDDPALEWFYLGSLDGYRIAFNDDYSRQFFPPKHFFRSETVDLQRGEVEWKGGNVYFDQWHYDFKWELLPAAAKSAGALQPSTTAGTAG